MLSAGVCSFSLRSRHSNIQESETQNALLSFDYGEDFILFLFKASSN